MNKTVKIFVRILAILCLLALILPFVLTAKAADTERYGYSLLINDNQRTAYQKIADGIGAGQAEIVFDLPSVTQETLNDVIVAMNMVTTDFPEYFWYTGGGGVASTNNTVTVTPNQYIINGQLVDAAAINSAKNAFNAVINEAKSKIPAGASDYQKSEIIHDFVDDKTEYQMVGDHQSAYGALVLGKAVCAGYARAYQVLMNAVGIRCWYISGTSYNPGGDLEAHAWNVAWLDGACVYTDVTWDDHRPTNFHHYLNLSLEQISTDHFPDKPELLPQSCGHNTYTYFKMNSGEGKGIYDMSGSESGADIAKYFVLKSLNGDQAEYFCRVHYHGDNFESWLSNNRRSLAEGLGLSGDIGFQEEFLGIEYQMTVTGTAKSGVTPPPAPTPTSAPTPTTAPTETTAPAQQTTPVQTQPAETQPAQTNAATTVPASTAPADTTAPAGTAQSTSPAQTTGTTAAAPTTQATTAAAGTTAPSGNFDTEEPSGSPVVIIVIVAAVLLAGGGAAVYFLKFRKKSE